MVGEGEFEEQKKGGYKKDLRSEKRNLCEKQGFGNNGELNAASSMDNW